MSRCVSSSAGMTLHFVSDVDGIRYLALTERIVGFALLVSLRVCEGKED